MWLPFGHGIACSKSWDMRAWDMRAGKLRPRRGWVRHYVEMTSTGENSYLFELRLLLILHSCWTRIPFNSFPFPSTISIFATILDLLENKVACDPHILSASDSCLRADVRTFCSFVQVSWAPQSANVSLSVLRSCLGHVFGRPTNKVEIHRWNQPKIDWWFNVWIT